MRYRGQRRLHDEARSASEIGADVDEEIAFHIEMRTAALIREGLAPAAAEQQALREFGDVNDLRSSLRRTDGRQQRRMRVAIWLDDLRQDVRFALRSFARAPLFAAVSIATLALGIGASVAIFTLVNTVLLRPLPYPTADRLVQVAPGMNFNIVLSREVAASSPSLEAATGLSLWTLTVTGQGHAARLTGQAVGADYFRVLGVQPALGRGFRSDEQEPATSGVVILSWDLWATRFGSDPGVIGRTIDVDGGGHQRREVIGVMPRGFAPPLTTRPQDVAFWIPLSVAAGRTAATDSTWYVNQVVGLLRPGASAELATAELRTTLGRVLEEAGPVISEETVQQAAVVPLHDSVTGDTRRTLFMLQGAVSLVLLLACANLANLLLARGDRRRHELAARAALGGTRARLIRELLTEAGVLAVLGATGGLLLAHALLHLLDVVDASGLPRTAELGMDGRVIGFAIVVTATSLLLFALLPALRATRGDLRPDIAASGRSLAGTRGGRRLGSLLIASEVALALMLVAGAGLLLQSLRTLRAVDAGMQTANVLAMEVTLPPAAYAGERILAFYDELQHRLVGLHGVEAAGAIHLLPFTGSNWGFPYLAEGHAPPAGAPLPVANFRITTPGYFATVGTPVLAGQAFDPGHAAGGSDVVINRTMAEQLWPGESAVGREIRLFGSMPLRVIGVVGDVHQHALDEAPQPEMYRPLSQWPHGALFMMVRTAGKPETLADAAQRVVWDMDPDVPVSARPLQIALDESMAQRSFFARSLTLFGLLALLLGAVGVYGVMSYAITARMPEFGIRMALGASAGGVLSSTLRSAMLPVLVGIAAGVAGALATTRLLQSLLFGVEPDDPRVFIASAIVLCMVGLLASWGPARRATRAEPMRVLRG
jgi:putative ABC transport system permease protein